MRRRHHGAARATSSSEPEPLPRDRLHELHEVHAGDGADAGDDPGQRHQNPEAARRRRQLAQIAAERVMEHARQARPRRSRSERRRRGSHHSECRSGRRWHKRRASRHGACDVAARELRRRGWLLGRARPLGRLCMILWVVLQSRTCARPSERALGRRAARPLLRRRGAGARCAARHIARQRRDARRVERDARARDGAGARDRSAARAGRRARPRAVADRGERARRDGSGRSGARDRRPAAVLRSRAVGDLARDADARVGRSRAPGDGLARAAVGRAARRRRARLARRHRVVRRGVAPMSRSTAAAPASWPKRSSGCRRWRMAWPRRRARPARRSRCKSPIRSRARTAAACRRRRASATASASSSSCRRPSATNHRKIEDQKSDPFDLRSSCRSFDLLPRRMLSDQRERFLRQRLARLDVIPGRRARRMRQRNDVDRSRTRCALADRLRPAARRRGSARSPACRRG